MVLSMMLVMSIDGCPEFSRGFQVLSYILAGMQMHAHFTGAYKS